MAGVFQEDSLLRGGFIVGSEQVTGKVHFELPKMKGRRVLITGGLGFIGSNLAHRCLQLGAEVTVYDCLDPRSGGNMFNVHEIKGAVKIILNDIRHFEGVSAAIINQDILFNCAAYTSHPNSMKEPLIDIDVNCRGVINILEAARRFNPDINIVQIGATTQIGRMLYSPIDELHPEFPLDIYSANKTASEKYVLIYGRAYGMHATVIRLGNVFGPRSNIKSPDFGFMNYFIGLGLQGKDIPVFGDVSQLRNISYVEDAVEALMLAALAERSNGEVLFAVSDKEISVLEVAEAISRHIGGNVRRMEWPKDREVIEVGDAVITNAKCKSLLNWSPRCELNASLVKTKEYFRKSLQEYLR